MRATSAATQLALLDWQPPHLVPAPPAPAEAPTRGPLALARWHAAEATSDCALTRRTRGKPEVFSRNEVTASLFAALFDVVDRYGFYRDDYPESWCAGYDDDAEESLAARANVAALLERSGWLLGDVYQQIDAGAVKRFAFCQTPSFVAEWMLERVLEPAMAEFGADNVRVIDPTCGTGHFLVLAFTRLAEATAEKLGLWPDEAAAHALPRVWGVDMNPGVLRIAHARMVLAAMQIEGMVSLRQGEDYAPLAEVHESDALLGMELGGFHVVIGNPPYIVEQDVEKKIAHRARYVSASRQYSLGAVFTERFFQIAAPGGYVAMLTANSFMKREFGKALVEKVLPGLDLTHVINTSGAYFHGHGTPTCILLGRNQPPTGGSVRAVMAKRGEPKTPYVWDPLAAAFGGSEGAR